MKGSPDVVIEILSPSTAYYDLKNKFRAYESHGVSEYWIVDPGTKRIEIYELMNFFVAMTKESHLCHVIIASSDAFFIEEVYNDSKLKKTSAFQNLDYLTYPDAVEWLSHINRYNEVAAFSLNEKEIELIIRLGEVHGRFNIFWSGFLKSL